MRKPLERHGWVGFALLALALFALLPVTAQLVDYGAEGWLWALFGLTQRRYVNEKLITDLGGTAALDKKRKNSGLMRLLACLIAAAVTFGGNK